MLGVAGGTCSGKTTVAERLVELMGEQQLALIKLDSYYWTRDDLPIEQRALTNWDHPESFDWPLLIDHVRALCSGEAVPVPIYDYINYTRSGEVRIVGPANIVVIEGILVLNEPELRELFDLKVYVDTDPDVRFIRRLERDIADRARTPASVIDQYLTTVRPMHLQFVEPSKRYADVIVPHGGMNAPAFDMLVARVRSLL